MKTPTPEIEKRPTDIGGLDAITDGDLSGRKQVEEALRQSDARYWLVAQTMLQGLVHQGADGKIIAMNPAAERILGKTREEFLGSSSVQQEHHTIRENGEPFPGLEHPSMMALRTGQPVRAVVMGVWNPRTEAYRWIRIDAVPVFLPGQTRPAEVYTVFEDITERKQDEESLRKMDRMLSESQKIAHLGSFEYVVETRTTVWSEEEFRIYGLDPAGPSPDYEVMLARHIHPGDAALLDKVFTAAMRNGLIYQLEHRIVRPDGSVRFVYDRAHPYFDAKGRLVRYVGATLDITERKRVEEELRASNQELSSFNQAMVGRELRMIELKKEIDALRTQLGQPPRYGSTE